MPKRKLNQDSNAKKIKNIAKKCSRNAYIPVLSNELSDKESVLESKFGGTPFISRKHKWPKCECGTKMTFFLQINSDHLPTKLNFDEVFGQGLLQFFYCTKCDDYQPNTDKHKVRIIQPTELVDKKVKKPISFEHKNTFEYRKIADWKEEPDFPRYDEAALELNDAEMQDYENDYSPKSCDKLKGWPAWIQGIEYPCCPICSKQMRYIFQLESERNVDYMFGDSGNGHISQCKDHPEQLTFTWACG